MDRIEHFKSCFIYDQDTGVLTWRRRPLEHFKNSHGCNTWNTKFAGKVAGSKDADGYLVVKIDFKSHRVHRVIWEMCNGPIPNGKKIDHEDHDRENNRLSNLRLTDEAGNAKNCSLRSDSKSGICGVFWNDRYGKWEAYLNSGGKSVLRKRFLCFLDAVAERKRAEMEFDFHANHGKRK